jgi:hypothetical protein
MDASTLRFRGLMESPPHSLNVLDRWQPDGEIVVNSKTWMGRPPRTCRIGRLSMELADPGQTQEFEIEVHYRSPDFVSYVGTTRYEGWDVPQVREQDGIPVDATGSAIPDGTLLDYEQTEVYPQVDFERFDFGELVEVIPVNETLVINADQLDDHFRGKARKASTGITFLAPLRHRLTGLVIHQSRAATPLC